MRLKKTLVTFALICTVGCSAVYYTLQLAAAKQVYRMQVVSKVEQFLQLQQALMQRLASQLLVPLHEADFATVSLLLRAYEDQAFVLAKQGLLVPLSIQWISLSAPLQIVTGNGIGDRQTMAENEAYYLQAVTDPTRLIISNPYTKAAMPEHNLLNVGLGITDAEQNYYGHLDTSLALGALQAHIAQNIVDNKFFTFRLTAPNLTAPEVMLRPTAYWLGVTTFSVSCGLLLLVVYALLAYILKWYITHKQQALALKRATDQTKSLTENIALLRNATQTQHKYGVLAADGACNTATVIHLQQLLIDMQAVNAEVAAARHIELKFPSHEAVQLQMYGNRLRLMQILSGVLFEILQQLPTNSVVTVQVVVTNLADNVRTIIFKFSDNGFYSALQERVETQSSADVRAKGWSNIQSLLAVENGCIEHVHTAYSGNTISISFTQQVVNNVIRLETYFEEA